MPLGPLAVAGVGAGLNILQNLFGSSQQNKINRQTQNFSREMYGRQRADAISDWNMQNEYNSPANAMKRLVDAGLNKNLAYGNGTMANSADGVRSSSAPNWSPTAPQFDFSGTSSAIMDGIDTVVKQAQANNLKANAANVDQDTRNKAVQLWLDIKRGAGIDLDNVNKATANKWQNSLLATSFEAAKAAVDKTKNDITISNRGMDVTERGMNVTEDSNRRANEKQPYEIGNLKADIQSKKAGKDKTDVEIDRLVQDRTINELDIELSKHGLYRSDPMYARIAAVIANAPSTKQGIQKAKELVTELKKPGQRLNLLGNFLQKWAKYFPL